MPEIDFGKAFTDYFFPRQPEKQYTSLAPADCGQNFLTLFCRARGMIDSYPRTLPADRDSCLYELGEIIMHVDDAAVTDDEQIAAKILWEDYQSLTLEV